MVERAAFSRAPSLAALIRGGGMALAAGGLLAVLGGIVFFGAGLAWSGYRMWTQPENSRLQ